MRLLETDIGKGEWVLKKLYVVKNSLSQRIKNLGIDL